MTINGLDWGHGKERVMLCERHPLPQSQNATSCTKWLWDCVVHDINIPQQYWFVHLLILSLAPYANLQIWFKFIGRLMRLADLIRGHLCSLSVILEPHWTVLVIQLKNVVAEMILPVFFLLLIAGIRTYQLAGCTLLFSHITCCLGWPLSQLRNLFPCWRLVQPPNQIVVMAVDCFFQSIWTSVRG